MNGVDLIVTITDRSRSEEFISLYQDCGITMIISALGHGTATGEILDYLSLEATEKVVLFCMTDHERTHAVVHRATRELWLDVPGNGILLTVPVSSIGGTATREYLLQEQPKEAGQKEMEKENTHELIVAIANRGSMDLVMRAARSAGATGGTVLHLYLGERIGDKEIAKAIIKKAFTNYSLPYISLTPTFSVCPEHGYITGEQYTCPKCGADTEVWSRVVGYLRPVQNYHKGKAEEWRQRVKYVVKPEELPEAAGK